MNFSRRHFLGAAVSLTAGASAPVMLSAPPAPPRPRALPVPAQGERPALLTRALAALDGHRQRIAHRDRVGLADYSVHSSEARFHIVDVANGRVLHSYLVSHGRGSDPGHTGWLDRFSNRPGSNASSRGSYLTADTYHGKYGRSRRLIGLDPENDLALERAIVVHGAPYVDPSLVEAQGRIGRSLGCFAFALDEIGNVMDLLGPGRLLFAWK